MLYVKFFTDTKLYGANIKKKKYTLQEQHNVVSIVEPIVEPAVHHENKLLTDHFYA